MQVLAEYIAALNEANRRLVNDAAFYRDVREKFRKSGAQVTGKTAARTSRFRRLMLARHDVRLTGVETRRRSPDQRAGIDAIGFARQDQNQAFDAFGKIDQHKADSRPNVIGWIGAAGVAVTISLSIGATIGGTVTALQSARANWTQTGGAGDGGTSSTTPHD